MRSAAPWSFNWILLNGKRTIYGKKRKKWIFCTISFAQFTGIMTDARRQAVQTKIKEYYSIIHNSHVKMSDSKVLERSDREYYLLSDKWMNGSILIKWNEIIFLLLLCTRCWAQCDFFPLNIKTVSLSLFVRSGRHASE